MRVELDTKRGITIIQEASFYTFTGPFKGLFAVAIRKSTNDKEVHFKLYYGNTHNYSKSDDDYDLEYVQYKIIESEIKYIKRNIVFDAERVDCDKKFYQATKVYLRENDEEVVTD